ncbi:MAG: SDR family oxidoreductase [Methanoregula sp.]|uniref:SDR family oxidoreductase n=1 Tax=Methanoregula sp. TaxID=2052170 RepID=UPI003BB1FF47
MKYIVTGGAGFIGSHIAEYLCRRDDEVIIFDDLFSGRPENIRDLLEEKNVTFVEGSVTDPDLLKKTFSGAYGIFHEAAIASVPRSIKNPLATNEANITGTLNVLIAARECGVKKVVFASSSSVYGDTPTLPKKEEMKPNPISPYAVSKLAGEYYCRVFSSVYNIPTVCLRYFNVFGPRQDPNSEYAAVIPRFILRILNNQPPVIYGDGNQTRDFTYVADVVQANILGMDRNVEGVFNIAYGSRISLNELAATLMELADVNLTPVFEPPRTGDVRHSLADICSARSLLGYTPKYTVTSGLQETLQWYQHQ